ncbi:MAG TPA: sugar transferase, partial [Gemmatimonadaceae bacterium]|nr:sugar transferase [Gemmatimonadaceae bacterium]
GSQQELVECFYAGVAASDAAKLYEELSGRVLIGQVGPDWYADLPTLPRRPYFGVKRLVDVVGGSLLLLVCVPLMLLLALLVLIDDGRPVLYRQVRLGRRGEPFVVRKFRTMRRDAEPEGPQYAQRRDPRTTRGGTFLRQSGLDELPQLWDVVRGKMSLIGPRPERPEFVDQLAAELPLYRARLLVRPGIVGWAEVHIRHSATLKEHLARLEYDLYYIKHAGVLFDANIALRAIGVVLSGR